MKNPINRMYILSFLFTLHISLSAYVNSTFLTRIISEKYVGLLYTIASVVTLILLSKSTSFLKYFGNRKFILWLLLINMAGFACLIVSGNHMLIALSFILILSTNALVFLCIDIFIEHFSNPKTVGRTRGLYLTVLSIAWMISPIITSILITKEGGYRTIYIIALISTVIMAIGTFFSMRTFSDKTYTKTPFLETYQYLKKNRHMMAITVINFILQFFYAWMVVYTPIYLLKHVGLGWAELGVIFAIMLSPFVIFDLPVGILIDKFNVSKRKLLYTGILIMSTSTMMIPFITTKSIALWALVLFLTRTGASIVETTTEIYFFTHVTEEDEFLLSIFRDMTPVAYIIAPLLATIIFMALPFQYLFIALALILMSGLYYIPRLRRSNAIEQSVALESINEKNI